MPYLSMFTCSMYHVFHWAVILLSVKNSKFFCLCCTLCNSSYSYTSQYSFRKIFWTCWNSTL